MSLILKEATACTVVIGPFMTLTDTIENNQSAATGLSITQARVRLSKNGSAFAGKNESTTCTHGENGLYLCPLDTTDTNTVGRLDISVYYDQDYTCYHGTFNVVDSVTFDALITGNLWTGNTITMALKQLNIQNNAGDAIYAASTGGNGAGINSLGNGSGHGLAVTGGATGTGLRCTGGASGGSGISSSAQASGSSGLVCVGVGTGYGIWGVGGAGASGIYALGGSSSGAGFYARGQAGNSQGIYATGSGSSAGIEAVGGATGHGISATAGATGGGHGLLCQAGQGSGGSGQGAKFLGGLSGGTGVSMEAQAAGFGLYAAGTGFSGIACQGGDSRAGFLATGGSGGNGAQFTKGDGGKDIDADEIDGIKTKTDYLPSVTAGNSGGLFIAGTNAATTITGALTTTFTGNLTGTIGGLSTQAKADVNAEVVDVIRTDALAELGVAAPSATPTLAAAIMLNYMYTRNKTVEDGSYVYVRNNAGTVICKAETVETGGTFTKEQFVAP